MVTCERECFTVKILFTPVTHSERNEITIENKSNIVELSLMAQMMCPNGHTFFLTEENQSIVAIFLQKSNFF